MKKVFLVISCFLALMGCTSLEYQTVNMWNENGVHKETNTLYDKEGYNKEGYDKEGYDKEGYDRQGYNKEGYNKEGFNYSECDKEGYNREGFDYAGYDRKGYDKKGYNVEGYDKEGYNMEGYDKEGYNRQGYEKNGYNKEGYDEQGYNREGWDKNGINRETLKDTDKNGYNKNNYQEFMGMWKISNYIDEFGEKTTNEYVTNQKVISGFFSNTATTDSRLNITFIVDKNNFAIVLYEYGEKHPVKNEGELYEVLIKDKNGKIYQITAINKSARLIFSKEDELKIKEIFSLGGEIKFKIETEAKDIKSEYKFKVDNANGFNNIYKKLKK